MNQNPVTPGVRGIPARVGATLDLVPAGLAGYWKRLLAWLTGIWGRLAPVFTVLFYCRFGVGVLAIAAGLLWLSGQGREIAVRVGDDLVPTLVAVLGAFFWAFHLWFDGRRVLRRRFGPDRGLSERGEHFKDLVDRTPRLLGSAAYAIAASSAFIAWAKLKFTLEAWHAVLVLLNLAGAVLFFYLMKYRKIWQAKLLGAGKDKVRDLEPWLVPFTWTYGILFFVAATVIPVHFGFGVGSLGIVFFALSNIVYFGSWLVRETTPRREQDPSSRGPESFPVMISLFLWAVALTFLPLNDNHRLPTLDSRPRPGLDRFLADWKAQAPSVEPTEAGAAPYRPMVFVATAGGGIRAGYWTAAVLGQITDALPSFRKSLFAVSGVSGGSVGTAVYAATVRELGQGCAEAAAKAGGAAPGCITDPALKSLSQEFLAPVVARMFYPDLVQRFLPVALLPDRATALSAAWQESWTDALGRPRTPGLDAPLASLAPGDAASGGEWLPALLLNSTHVETGQRVVASNLDLDQVFLPGGGQVPAFLNAVDLTGLLKADVTLGTAALNSARFTYVSPPGTLPCPDGGLVSFCSNGHVVDGGYFENFGAVTARQLLEAVPREDTLRPLVILISNDAGLGNAIEDDMPPSRLPSEGVANETLAPVRALLDTRGSRGILAAKELRAAVGPDNPANPRYFHFRMILEKGQAEPALGWALDKSSERLLRHMLTCTEGNRETFVQLLEALGVSKDRAEKAAECRA